MTALTQVHHNTRVFFSAVNLPAGYEEDACRLVGNYSLPNYKESPTLLAFVAKTVHFVAFRLFETLKALFNMSDWQIAKRSLKDHFEKTHQNHPALCAQAILDIALLIENEKSQNHLDQEAGLNIRDLANVATKIEKITGVYANLASSKGARAYLRSF